MDDQHPPQEHTYEAPELEVIGSLGELTLQSADPRGAVVISED